MPPRELQYFLKANINDSNNKIYYDETTVSQLFSMCTLEERPSS